MKRKIAIVLMGILLIATMSTAITNDVNKNKPSANIAPFIMHGKQNLKNSDNIRGEPFYGYLAYPSPEMLIYFYPSDPGTLYNLSIPASSSFLAGACFVGDYIYACEFYYPPDYPDDYIWKIDPTTGNMTVIGNYGVSDGLNGLAYDTTTNTLYGCSSSSLYVVNITTGSTTYIGNFGTGGVMIGIACDSNGNLYGEDLGTDSLYSINKTTGSATLIGALGLSLNYAQDMAFDKDTDTCYLAAFQDFGGGIYEGALYVVNVTTASATKIGDFGTTVSEITAFAIPYITNLPPETPTLQGPTQGIAGIEYTFSANTTDPNGDDLYYMFDWGDGSNTTWLGPYPSGITVMANHSWNAGIYNVKVKAKDENGAESNWSLPIGITIASLFTANLYTGWNFVTIPCENNYTASSLYNSIQGCNLILKWNNSKNDFDVYTPGSPNNFVIENGIGYFISVSNNTILSVTGMPIQSVNITLLVGWNSLGWFNPTQTNASNIYNNIAGCNIVLRWNNSKDDFDVYVPGAPDFVIEQGNGFFVSVSQQSQWHG